MKIIRENSKYKLYRSDAYREGSYWVESVERELRAELLRKQGQTVVTSIFLGPETMSEEDAIKKFEVEWTETREL